MPVTSTIIITCDGCMESRRYAHRTEREAMHIAHLDGWEFTPSDWRGPVVQCPRCVSRHQRRT